MKQESLHELIHSMSSAEKRYFKVFAGGETAGKQQRYLQLFDLLAGMEIFDAGRIQGGMEWGNYRANYAVSKRYLYDKILQSLAAFEGENTVVARMATQLQQVRILVKRGLQGQAIKKIRKAKRTALAVEAWEPLLELLKLERKLFVRNTEKVFDLDGLSQLNQEINFAIQGIVVQEKIQEYHYRLFGPLRLQGGFSNSDGRAAMDALIAECRELDVLEGPFVLAKFNFLNVLQQYEFAIGNLQESQQILGRMHALMESHAQLRQEYLGQYLASLNNYCNRALANSDYAACMRVLHRMHGLRPRDLNLRSQWEESYYGLGMSMLINAGQLAENQKFMAAMTKVAQRPISKIGRAFLLRFNLGLAILYFMQGELLTSLRHLQQVVQDPDHAAIRAIDRVARLLEMLVHLELGNLDWLAYRLPSLLKKKPKSSDFALEKAFGNFLKIAINSFSEAETRSAAADFLLAGQALRADGSSIYVFSMFDFTSWAMARSQGKKFLEILHENWAKKSDLLVRLEP